jgi:hypothetical protein
MRAAAVQQRADADDQVTRTRVLRDANRELRRRMGLDESRSAGGVGT